MPFNKKDYGFGRSFRLLKADEFQSILKLRNGKNVDHFIRIHTKKNVQNHPRIGLIVSKKVSKKAHDRNYVKRRLREWFRKEKSELPNLDLIIQVKIKFDKNHFSSIEKHLNNFLSYKTGK